MLYIILLSFISLILLLLSLFLSSKNIDKEKLTIYECGFMMITKIGNPFSIKFFIIAILFLVFDLEIVLLLPWSVSIYTFGTIYSHYIMLIFLLILIVSLAYEWFKGGLEWD